MKTFAIDCPKQPVVSSRFFDEPKKCGAFFLTALLLEQVKPDNDNLRPDNDTLFSFFI